MPQLEKEALSQFIGTECERQLRLNLHPKSTCQEERNSLGMPPIQRRRPGMEHVREAGEVWQEEKVADLSKTFGMDKVIGNREIVQPGREHFDKISLIDVLNRAKECSFLIEAEFEVTNAFKKALGIEDYGEKYKLSYSNLRPDIIEVLPPNKFDRNISPDGSLLRLIEDDKRLQLRVIDIKLTAEPSPSYFAEVTYYSMVLAGWLIDNNLDKRFVVVPNAAVWPGSHDASNLVKFLRNMEKEGVSPSYIDLWNSLTKDLEPAPFEIFAGRIRHFFLEEIPKVFSKPWNLLPWHVDNRCKYCGYLGYPWKNKQGEFTNHPLHCIPTAERVNHLSRVSFMSRGASIELIEKGVLDVSTLSKLSPQSLIFDNHYFLRASRHIISGRANSLETEETVFPEMKGISGTMPRWADLHIYLTINFDVGSAITFALGLQAYWSEHRQLGSTSSGNNNNWENWGPFTYIVDQKDLTSERRELLRLLNQINDILTTVREWDRNATVQFYIWDSIQYKHLARIIGRHLQEILADQNISSLAWLIPPDQLLPNARNLETNRSPITIVKEVVRTLLAVPIPHYYTLFTVARKYHHSKLRPKDAEFKVPFLFEDFLSDQIPSERAHEIWTKAESWGQRLRTLQDTVEKQLTALKTITYRLESDLRNDLRHSRAPLIPIDFAPRRQDRISFDGQLWYGFAKLNSALDNLEIHQIRAMPPHEREARFQSARLTRRLVGNDEIEALSLLGLQSSPRRRVYELSSNSKEVKLREGDFNFALAPESDPNFLNLPLQIVTQDTPLQPGDNSGWRIFMDSVTKVNIKAIDRDLGLIVLDPNDRYPTFLDDLEYYALADFSKEVVLDPVWMDTFTDKLKKTLQAIGNPRISRRENSLVRRAVGLTGRREGNLTPNSPVADYLWSGQELSKTEISRELRSTKEYLVNKDIDLNPSQWQAWELALKRRLQLIWGPPGTGKSRTLRTILLGAVLEACLYNKPVRILICAPTYNAIDNVLLDFRKQLLCIAPDNPTQVYRIRPKYRINDDHVPPEIDLEFDKRNPSTRILKLKARLEDKIGVTVVSAPPEQIHNLLTINNNPAQQGLFDIIIIDEASQMDVAHAILAIASIAQNSSLIIAGDPKQLPPIHKAKPPVDLGAMVGSVYEFYKEIHKIQHAMLEENYRSNSAIINFSLEAGYPQSLQSHSPNLCLNLIKELPKSKEIPYDWPEKQLFWTSEWSSLINPEHPLTCFVYPEGKSGQWNRFESDAVASLVYLIYGHLGKRLQNELDHKGNKIPCCSTPYGAQEFWKYGIGIVTPHRAQQALIVSRLQQVFPSEDIPLSLIRDSVDTVERFQGQQRDIIIASYALGDQDAIQKEDEFLMSLNRFNVMSSRARAKLIVFVSQEIINHLSGDIDVLRESRLLKVFAELYCNNSRKMNLGYINPKGKTINVEGIFKYRN
jgi:hypothetical protein